MGDITVEHNIFRLNTTTNGYGGGLSGGSDAGNCRYASNLIHDNSALYNTAASLTCNGSSVQIINNTVTENTSLSVSNHGGMRIGGSAPLEAANNIFWNNTNDDLILDSSSNTLLHNDIQDLDGTPGAGSANNLSVDPQFVSISDFHLQEGSPLINAGLNAAPAGVPDNDLDGRQRIIERDIDMGAYEYPGSGFFVIPGSNGKQVIINF